MYPGRGAAILAIGLAAAACRFDESGLDFYDAAGSGSDAATADAATGEDAAAVDAPPGTPDAMTGADASAADAGAPDAAPPDASAPDAATIDAAPPDASGPDAGCKGWDLGVVSPNIHPCDIPPPTGGWTISGGDFIVDTDAVTIRNTFSPTENPIPAATAVVTQTGGPDILVVSVDSFTISSGWSTVDVTVVGSRALAIVSFGDVTLDGNLSVGAQGATSGPGGDHAAACGASGRGPAGIVQVVSGENVGTGAGGGAYGSNGGGGAKCDDATGPNPAVSGGTANGNTGISPLRGGCRGGVGGNGNGNAGGAGGAIEILSGGTISVPRQLSARGGGGRGASTDHSGGGGAGAGGAIRLVAATAIVIDGRVTANGGGGGEGTRGFTDGNPGSDGHTNDEDPAAGGNGLSAGGNGGPGATRTANAGNGTQGSSDPDNDSYAGGGGGGGGVGRIHLEAPAVTRGGSSIVSPAPQ